MPDFSNFLDVQTKTAWGRILIDFASFCAPSTGSGQRPTPASLILDIGSGPGLLPAIFSRDTLAGTGGHTAYGIDHDFALLNSSLFPNLAQADALNIPFASSVFNLITATNVLFLLPDPISALKEWRRLLTSDGQLCLLNPSENMSIAAATQLADQRKLDGTARQSLLYWAHNAETYASWTEGETKDLLAQAGFRLEESVLRVGPGFARFARAKLC